MVKGNTNSLKGYFITSMFITLNFVLRKCAVLFPSIYKSFILQSLKLIKGEIRFHKFLDVKLALQSWFLPVFFYRFCLTVCKLSTAWCLVGYALHCISLMTLRQETSLIRKGETVEYALRHGKGGWLGDE